jgi:hypothetical protein
VRHRGQKRPLTGQEADLSQELTRAVGGNERFWTAAVVDENVHLAIEDHYQVVIFIALGEQNLAGRDFLLCPIPAHGLELCGVQNGRTARLGERPNVAWVCEGASLPRSTVR